MSTACEAKVFQSRWGHHPCSYDVCRKLKEIGKYYHRARHAYYDWVRWARKDPQNRVIRKYHRDADGRKCGFEVVGPKPEPQRCPLFLVTKKYGGTEFGGEGELFVEAYKNARHPRSEENVQPLKVSLEYIDQFLAACQEFFGNS